MKDYIAVVTFKEGRGEGCKTIKSIDELCSLTITKIFWLIMPTPYEVFMASDHLPIEYFKEQYLSSPIVAWNERTKTFRSKGF